MRELNKTALGLITWLVAAMPALSAAPVSGSLIAAALLASPTAEANLTIAPTRVLLTDRERSTTVTVANPTTQTRTYRIEWLVQRMNENGTYTPFEPGPNEVTLSSMIRHSPKRVTVPAGGHQKVRLQLRAPADLPAGEYRSHLLFKVEPLAPSERDDADSGAGATVKVHVNLSFSIPVIYRRGSAEANISLEEIAFQRTDKGEYQMVVLLSRSGDSSSFGRIEIYLNRGGNSREELVGQLRSVSVFADSPRRRLSIPLSIDALGAGDVVRFIYKGEAEFAGKVWAEKSFRVGR